MKKFMIIVGIAAMTALTGCKSYRGGAEGTQHTISGTSSSETNKSNTVSPQQHVYSYNGTHWQGKQPPPP